MENNTTEVTGAGNSSSFDVHDILMYTISTSNLIINASPVLMFLVQRWRRPVANRLSPAGVLVLNLLITDALLGAMGIYVTALVNFKSEPNSFTLTPFGCVNAVNQRFFFRTASHMALISVTVDRYIAVMHTLHYRDWMTVRRSWVLIGISWLVPVLTTSFSYITNDWTPGHKFCYEIQSFDVFVAYVQLPYRIIALILVVFILCRIFFYLRNHEKNESPQHLRQYSRKSAHILIWVTVAYIICWLPYNVFILFYVFDYQKHLFIFLKSTTILAYCSYTVNAFIFSYKTENIRKPVSDLWRDVRHAVACGAKEVASGDVNHNKAVMGNKSSISTTTSPVVSQDKLSREVTLHI